MAKNSFERMGGTCHRNCDYQPPDVFAPEEPRIGFWGRRRREYLRKHKASIYTGMLLSGTLNAHLEEIDKQAEEMLDLLIAQMAERESITEQLKAED